MNQFLPGLSQGRANFDRSTTAIDHCLEIALQFSPAVPSAVIGQLVESWLAIADYNAIEIMTLQMINFVTGTRRSHG